MPANEKSKHGLEQAHGGQIGIPTSGARNARATLRYALQTDVAFVWTGADGIARNGHGQTRDISQKGAFVESSSYPPKGASVKMSIHLPATLNTEKSLRMEAQGRVVRVEPGCEPRGPTLSGFAVSTEQVSLCPS
jgi:PilZ domain